MTEPEDTERAPSGPSFGEAMEELEEILQRIEGDEIDIDALAEELRRAALLLELARAKLRRAEVEVTQIVQGLETDEGHGVDGAGEDAAGEAGAGEDAAGEDGG